MSQRLNLLMQMNPDFAKAVAKGEKWAVQRVEAIRALDGYPTSRRFPERDRQETGRKQNWCGSCPFVDGCMVCDLPYDPSIGKLIGAIVPYKLTCKICGYQGATVEAVSIEEAENSRFENLLHRRRLPRCTARLTATRVKDPMA